MLLVYFPGREKKSGGLNLALPSRSPVVHGDSTYSGTGKSRHKLSFSSAGSIIGWFGPILLLSLDFHIWTLPNRPEWHLFFVSRNYCLFRSVPSNPWNIWIFSIFHYLMIFDDFYYKWRYISVFPVCLLHIVVYLFPGCTCTLYRCNLMWILKKNGRILELCIDWLIFF